MPGARIPAFSNRPVPSDAAVETSKSLHRRRPHPRTGGSEPPRRAHASTLVDQATLFPEPTDLPFLNRNPTVDWAPEQPPAWYAASTRHEPGGHTGITGRPQNLVNRPVPSTHWHLRATSSYDALEAVAPQFEAIVSAGYRNRIDRRALGAGQPPAGRAEPVLHLFGCDAGVHRGGLGRPPESIHQQRGTWRRGVRNAADVSAPLIVGQGMEAARSPSAARTRHPRRIRSAG